MEKKEIKYPIPRKYTIKYYDFLISSGWIIGYLDQNDEVHSILTDYRDAEMHGDYFRGIVTTRRWRWDWSNSFRMSAGSEYLNEGDYDKIIQHIEKKYDIKFWDNGHHDIDYLTKKSERKNKKEKSIW